MLEVHEIIHKYKATLARRKLHEEVKADPITHAATVISEQSHLLCFDEFQVTDIADAIIMTKLFNELWKRGTILVATSNRPPKDLYLGGLNRQYFLPFIAEVQEACHVAHLKSHVDYRQLMSVRKLDPRLIFHIPWMTSELRFVVAHHAYPKRCILCDMLPDACIR